MSPQREAKEKRYERELGRNNLGGKTEVEVRGLGTVAGSNIRNPRHFARAMRGRVLIRWCPWLGVCGAESA